jgi:hypothetical protein
MKLTREQIEELYTFVRKKGIEFIDLQDELVDYLANGIETQREEDSSLSFAEALQKEYKKFGIFGFDDVLMEKMKSIERRGLTLYLNKLKQFFKIPQVIFTLSLVALFYYLCIHFEFFEYMFLAVILLSVAIVIYFEVKTFKEVRVLSKKYLEAKSFITTRNISTWVIYFVCYVPVYGNFYAIIQVPIFSACLLSIVVIEILIHYELINELRKELREKHNYIFEG